ncbi:hypothetical protein TNCV_4966281 [Trichonephila clavipes]|nr:hypothetical protein TNCV_4966281 [Trichonephila clavipes]
MDVCVYDLALPNTVQSITMKIGMYMYFYREEFCAFFFVAAPPPGGASAYRLLHSSINHQVANLTQSPTFRYVSTESIAVII